MKILLITVALLSIPAFANEYGKELHQESCSACHIVHNKDFYTRSNRKVDSISRLKGQVSMCSQAFNVGWFPAEEKDVVDYLNKQFYKF